MIMLLTAIFTKTSQSSMFINPEFFNHFSFNKSSSKSKKQRNPIKATCKLFLAVVFNSWNWSKPFNTKKHSFKIELFFSFFVNCLSNNTFSKPKQHILCLNNTFSSCA